MADTHDDDVDEAAKEEMERSYVAAAKQFEDALPRHVDGDLIGAAVQTRDTMAAAHVIASSFAGGAPVTLDQVIDVYDRLVATMTAGPRPDTR